MRFYIKDKAHVDRGTATLRNAVDSAKRYPDKLLAKTSDCSYLYNQQELWCETIQTKLIEYVGRYCDRFGSDLICTLSDLDAFLRDDTTEDDPFGRWVIGVGIRADGVDHNAWIMSNARNTESCNGFVYPEHYYRKILAIDIELTLERDSDGDCWYSREIHLYDITTEFTKLDEEDK